MSSKNYKVKAAGKAIGGGALFQIIKCGSVIGTVRNTSVGLWIALAYGSSTGSNYETKEEAVQSLV